MTENSNPGKVSPQKYDNLDDIRNDKKSGDYPNYWTKRTRSGHVMTFDDSAGAEHITLQHRGGSMIQFMPDGAVSFTSHNGQYNLIFGENRVKITGAYDVTVEGGGSLKVDGDYNVTVGKNMNYTVAGDVNMASGGNFSLMSGGSLDVVAQSQTVTVDGTIDVHAHRQIIQSEGAMTVSSKGGTLALNSNKDISLYSNEGEVEIQSRLKAVSVVGKNVINYAENDLSIKGETSLVVNSGGKTTINGDKVHISYGSEGQQKPLFEPNPEPDNSLNAKQAIVVAHAD